MELLSWQHPPWSRTYFRVKPGERQSALYYHEGGILAVLRGEFELWFTRRPLLLNKAGDIL